MNRIRYFFAKLACALIALVTISSVIPTNESQLPQSQQVVYAKKAKRKTKKKVRQKVKRKAKKSRKVVVSPSWRWKKPQARVYIALNDNKDLIAATNDAIDAWNNTGTFTFKRVNKRKKADILITQVYSPHSNYAGYTTFHYYIKTKLLQSAVTRLNVFYLGNFSNYNYSYNRIVNTVEHELGHAIGLTHNNDESVMYPVGSLYPIEEIDIANTKKLYQN